MTVFITWKWRGERLVKPASDALERQIHISCATKEDVKSATLVFLSVAGVALRRSPQRGYQTKTLQRAGQKVNE